MQTAAEWWTMWQLNEQELAELQCKLHPETSFVANATVIATIGHGKDAQLALAVLESFSRQLRKVEVDGKIAAVVAELLSSKGALE